MIDVLTAIRWVKQAWDAVSADTIINCFKHCGVQPLVDEATDPFADLDEESEDEQERDGLQNEELVQQFDPELNADDENWREELREEILSGGHAKKQAVSESDSEEEDGSVEDSPSTITTFMEAIDCGNNLLKFLTE